MTIAFVCPSGHQLSAPDALAGKPGKCPHCGSKFLIPTLEEVASAGKDEATEPAAVEPKTAPNAADSGKKSPEPADGLFVFLCPNGHRLNGSPSLKGKAGKCPHCGARFLVPSDDEAPSDDDDEEEESQDAETHAPSPEDEAAEQTMEVIASTDEPRPPDTTWRLPPPEPSGAHRLAELFTWFWAQRESDCNVALLLKDGQSYAPQLYAPELSQHGYGVFARRSARGQFTLTTIAWDQVAQVTIENLDQIPYALFE